MPLDKIDHGRAVAICRVALNIVSTSHRLNYQLQRSLISRANDQGILDLRKNDDIFCALDELSKKGYAPASNQLGRFYYSVNFVPKSKLKAFEYYSRAAAIGDALGIFMISSMLVKGDAGEKDETKINTIFELTKKGQVNSQRFIASYFKLKNQIQKAIFWYENAAAALDLYLFFEDKGPEYGRNRAMRWLNKAANQYYFPARCVLATNYIYRHLVKRKLRKAYNILNETNE